METKLINTAKGFVIGLSMIGCLFLGVWHGTSLGDAKAIAAVEAAAEAAEAATAEYDLGFDAGWKSALYDRPVSEELEMVCLGLWISRLPEKKQ